VRHPDLQLASAGGTGRTWVAARALSAGTCLLVEQPACSVLDRELQAYAWWDGDGADTCALFIAWMDAFLREQREGGAPSLWDVTRCLHPANAAAGPSSEEEWGELAANLPDEAGALLARIRALATPARPDLPLVWRSLQLNSLGAYTHPEHQGGAYEGHWRPLTSTGVYPLAAIGFNHSCRPNTLRTCAGPLMLFRAARAVARGEALSISYIGHDALMEPRGARLGDGEGGLGGRDFVCGCTTCEAEAAAAAAAGGEDSGVRGRGARGRGARGRGTEGRRGGGRRGGGGGGGATAGGQGRTPACAAGPARGGAPLPRPAALRGAGGRDGGAACVTASPPPPPPVLTGRVSSLFPY
jgi:hypothetical protein